MAFNKLEDTNALLLYRVGPVLMCSPTLQVESVIVPPVISRANASSDDEPGMFRSMYGMVRVVDLRVRFGVDSAQRKQPGQIVIVEVVGGHAGFWVDEIQDVIAFPQTGWSQVPSHVPGSVFSRTLLQGDDIRLYAEFERLDSFKASGYLREHIRSLQQAAKIEQTTSAEFRKTPEKPVTPAVESTPSHAATEIDAQPNRQVAGEDAATRVLLSSANRLVDKAAPRSPASQPEPPRPAASAQQRSANHPPSSPASVMPYRQTEAGQKADSREPHQLQPIQNAHKAVTTVSVADQAGQAGGGRLQTQPTSSVTAQDSPAAGWLWWLLPLLLLFVLLYMFVQNSQLLQGLVAEDQPPALQSRVDLQNDTVLTVPAKTVSNHASQNTSEASTDKAATITDAVIAQPAVQIADDLADVIYIEPESGDLTITVNNYQEDRLAEDRSAVMTSTQDQLAAQPEAETGQASSPQILPQQRQAETEQPQVAPSVENETADSELIAVDKRQNQSAIQASADEVEKTTAAEGVAEKAALQKSRRLQHIVVKGDTLWSITGRYINKPWLYPEIARLSNIDNPHLIYPGQRVIIVLNYKKPSG